MKKRVPVIFFLFASLSGACQNIAPSWVSIKAFLPGWNQAIIALRINQSAVVTTTIEEGMFSFNFESVKITEGEVSLRDGKRSAYAWFFIEPGVIRFRDDGSRIVAFGTPLNDRYNELESQWDSMSRVHANGNRAAAKRYKQQQVAGLVLSEPDSEVSLRMLYQYYFLDPSADDTLYYRLFQSLSPRLQITPNGKKMSAEVQGRYSTAYGRPASLLELADTANNLKPVYRKGEYTLLHFWASWCMPCKKMNESLKHIYRMYASENFRMVGISLDRLYSAWTTSIKNENLQWEQLSDLKSWSSVVATEYGIRSVPYNILIDPAGIIVAKNVTVNDIKKWLLPDAINKVVF